jgi:hypothetical protein
MGIMGPAGAGKTWTALLLARGIAQGKLIAGIDTENHRMLEYADRIRFRHLDFTAPYTPDRFVGAIEAAARMVGPDGVIVVDSASHAWSGRGGVLDIKNQASGKGTSDPTGWKKATPEQDKFMGAVMACGCHIIVTMRAKMAYDYQVEGGRTKVTKVGLAPIQRPEAEYEFSVLGSIDMEHALTIVKCSNPDFMDHRFVKPGSELGEQLREWLDAPPAVPDYVPPPVDREAPEVRGTTVIPVPAGGTVTPTPASPVPAAAPVPAPPAPPAGSLSPDEIASRFHEEPPPDEEPPLETWKRPETAAPTAQQPALGTDRKPTRFQLKDIAVHAGEAGYTDDVAAHVHVDTICQELFGYGILGPDGEPHYTNIRSARDAAQIDARLKDEAKKAAS